ncbi:hypothetical protein PBI_DAMIEN_68 [Mycobacterium phage Damien]|uniref:hypothetical protein n=1 Tax=Mycobacterium phage Damien TaxID=1486469 RepID=UPI00045F74A5|nr:hypothetical protein HL12_gp68 [Mycobacterium phage Damien]AHZ95429.1 hypothetical protein PBI_DAMIEN_68 [Mycobacterium phage Damien]
MTHPQGPSIDFDAYPPETPWRFWKFEAEDGTTFDYAAPWWESEQMEQIPDPFRSELETARTQALWVGFEALFRGELPGYPKAVRVITEHRGTRDSLPPWWGHLS